MVGRGTPVFLRGQIGQNLDTLEGVAAGQAEKAMADIPCVAAFEGRGPVHVARVDARPDVMDERQGVRLAYGSPMRRAAGKPWLSG